MSCKIKNIEDRFRETNPELADKLNDLTFNTWNTLLDSKLFEEKDNELYVNKEGTKKRVQQNNLIESINKDILYQNQTNSNEGHIVSEKTIRDLAARISDRIGIPYKFESDRSKQYKGKIENNTSVINLAYATLDTPIHEILGHPIIRALKNNNFTMQYDENGKYIKNNTNQLYQNLLKELEYGRGKEVLDRIKKDYNVKNENTESYYYKYDDFLGEYKIYDKTGKFIDNYGFHVGFREEVKAKNFVNKKIESVPVLYYTLEEQQEEAIVELMSLMVAEKLDNVKDGKLISLLKRLLKEMKQFIRSLLNQKEVEIGKLPDNMTLGDLSDLLAYSNSKLILPGYEVEYTTPDNQKFKTYQEASNHISQLAKSVEDIDLDNIKINLKPTDKLEDIYVNRLAYSNVKEFIQKNKSYEQSKEIIEEWKKVNNIVYNPEEIYSRGQEFVSVVGAYSNFDVNLMMQNLLSHIEDNEKAGGKFAISAFTKPVDRNIGHLEGGGGKIKFKIYPQSQDILWAANTDVYSGSVWDASEKVNKDKKSELLGVSYTKYPSLNNINTVQPNLASIVDELSHHHNELGITLTGNNFRLEYDEDIPYQTKKIINGINAILDQKYGKLVKPEIGLKKLDNPKIKEIRNKIDLLDINIAIGGLTKEEQIEYDNLTKEYQELTKNAKGIKPTITKNNLKESIHSIENSFKIPVTNYYVNSNIAEYLSPAFKTKKEAEDFIKIEQKKGFPNDAYIIEKQENEFDNISYTEQALINTKIAALKEVAKKYPRSLIRSEVVLSNKISRENRYQGFEGDELPFQKIPVQITGDNKVAVDVLKSYPIEQTQNKVDSKFSPAQLSDALKPMYQRLLEINNNDEVKTQNELLFGPKVVFTKAYTNENGEDVGLYHLKSEDNPNFIAMNGSLGKSIEGLKKDLETVSLSKEEQILYENTDKFENLVYKGVEYPNKESLINAMKKDGTYFFGVPEFLRTVTKKEKNIVKVYNEDYENELTSTNIETVDDLRPFLEDSTSELIKESPANIVLGNMNAYIENDNTIYVDIAEIEYLSKKVNVPKVEILNAILQHELYHSLSTKALRDETISKKVRDLFNFVKNQHSTNSFDDVLRGFYTKDGLPYALLFGKEDNRDINEFMAEAFSNIYFKQYLQNITTKENKSVWETIIDYIKDFFNIKGPKKDNVYDQLMEIYMSDHFKALQEETEVLHDPTIYYYNKKTTNEYMTEFLDKNDLSKVFTTKIADFVNSIKKVSKTLPYDEKSPASVALKELLSVIDNKDEQLNLGAMLQQMTVVRNILSLIEKQAEKEAKEAKTDIERIGIYSANLKKIEAFSDYISFSDQIKNDISKQVDLDNELLFLENESITKTIKPNKSLLRLLENVSGARGSMLQKLNEYIKDPIYQYLYDTISEESQATIAKLDNEIQDAEAKLLLPDYQNDKSQKHLKDKINEKQKVIKDLIPSSPEWFKNHLAGDGGTLGLINKMFEAAQVSKSPVIQIVAKMFKTASLLADRASMEEANIAQTAFDLIQPYVGNTIKIEDYYKPILTTSTVIEDVDNEGNITKSYKRDSLLSIYTPEFKEEYQRLKTVYNNTGNTLRILRQEDKDETEIEKAELLYNNAKKAFLGFKENYTEREYTNKKYEVDAIYEDDIHKDYPGVSLKSEKGTLYAKRNLLYTEIYSTKDAALRAVLIEELQFLDVKIRGIETLHDKVEGTKEWYLAQQALKYKEGRLEIGDYILSKEDNELFKQIRAFKIDEVQKGLITDQEIALWNQQNTRLVADQSWHDQRKVLIDNIGSLWEEVSSTILNDTQDNMFKNMTLFNEESNKDKKEGYEKLRELTKSFRDSDNIINGFLVNKSDIIKGTNITAQVKALNEALEEIRQVTESISSGQSVYEKSLNLLSADTKKNQSKAELERLGLTETVKSLKSYQTQLAKLSDTITTEYYDQAKEEEASKLIVDINEDELTIENHNTRASFEYNGIRLEYNKLRNQLTRVENDGTLNDSLEDQSYEDFLNSAKRLKAYDLLEKTEWYKNNHYEKMIYDTMGNEYTMVMEPIYIWNNTEPSDKTLIDRVPSFKYYSFQLKEDVLNTEYKETPDGLPLPKKDSKYENKEYLRLKNSTDPKDIAYYQLLETSRKLYHDSQLRSSVPKYKRFGDDLPSVSRNADIDGLRKGVEFTTNLKTYGQEVWRNLKGHDEEDLNDEMQGIVSAEYIKNQEIPLQFTGKLSTEKQSKNVLGSILMFSLNTLKREELLKIQPVVTSIYKVAEEGSNKTVKRDKNNLEKIVTAIKGESSDITEVLDNLIKAELYGSRVDNTDINILGININKALNSIMGATAFSSFVGNVFSPVKNTISGKVQSYIEQNKKYGKYSEKNWLYAEKESLRLSGELLRDYNKFGNQSMTNQLLDYFQVMQGTRLNKLGHKTNFNKVKNMTELLTSPKDYSEYQLQLTQFLAYADATYIETKEGKKKLLDVFELKNGTLKVKDIFTKEQKESFDKKTVDFTFNLHHMNLFINGAYREEEKSIAQRNIFGRAAFFMNQYLLPGLARRYAGKRFYLAEGDVQEGFWRTSLRFLFSDTKKYGFNFTQRYQELTDIEKHNLTKFAKEQLIIVALWFLYTITKGGDDDDEMIKSQKLALAYIIGISMEVQTFNPIAGSDELLRKIKNPFVFARTLSLSRNAAYYSLLSVIDDPTATYQKDSGIHKKGDSKAMASLYRLLSISPANIATFDIDALYAQQKMLNNNAK